MDNQASFRYEAEEAKFSFAEDACGSSKLGKAESASETAIQFKKEHWQPCERAIDDYLRALQNLLDILERAEREAGDM